MQRWRSVCLGGALIALVAGCGQGQVSGSGQGGGVPGSASGSNASPKVAPTAAPVTGSHALTIDPVMYPAGSNCVAVAATEPVAMASGPCADDWFNFASAVIPGQQDVTQTALTTISVGPGANMAAAGSLATAYVRTASIDYWAANHADTALIQALGIGASADDPAQAVVQQHGSFSAYPRCMLPTAISVAVPGPAVVTYFSEQGYPAPPTQVMVVTYPACAGVTYVVGAGPVTRFGRPSAVSYVVIPAQQDLGPPLGTVAVPATEIACGPVQLASVCGT